VTRRRRSLAICGALAIAGLAIWLGVQSTARPAAARELRFAPGTEYEYAVSWQSRQSTLVADGRSFDGAVDLRGRLVVHAYAADSDGDGWRLGVRFAALDTHDVAVLGQALVPDAATAGEALAGEAVIEIGRDGVIGGITFDRSAPPLFARLVPVLAAQLEFRLAAGETWQADSPGPFGSSTARYGRTASGANRTRAAYSSLAIVAGGGSTREVESAASVVLAPEGHWTRITDAEHVRVRDDDGRERADAEVALALDLVAIRRGLAVAGPSPTGRDRRMPGPAIADPTGAHAALVDRVDGLSRADLLRGLSANGAIADLNRWLWRATGLLQLDAALAAELGDLVATGRLTGNNAELALDLLASAGTPEAQTALRTALASPPVRGAPGYGLLVQRVSLVAHPTPETAAFVGELYRRESRDEVAYALGATIRHLDEAGDGTGEAARWNRVLVDDLEHAVDPAQQAVLLGALGNAARTENVELVARHATSDDPDVRAAAARALRHTDVPRAREALHALFGDRDTGVQREAIGALAKHRLGDGDLATLERTVAAAGIGAGNEGGLVTLIAAQAESPTSTKILRAIAARPGTLPDLRARIEQLLARRSS
jgi:hypothetical protein